MTSSGSGDNLGRRALAETALVSVDPTYKSETRVDITLLVSALFLQRFSLPFGKTSLAVDLVLPAFILLHQFLSGKLLIQPDRLLWLLAAGLLVSCSLVLNFESASVTSYSLFLVLCSLLTLSRPSNPDQYKSTLRGFQFLVMILSCIAVPQFFAQFVINGADLIMFYGFIPKIIMGGGHTVHEIEGSSVLKATGLFLAEPSNLSQVAGLGILIEVLEFRRPLYLLVMVLGFLLAYSGAGVMTLLLCLPFASFHHSRAVFSVLLVGVFVVALFATGIIDISVFQSRTAELDTPGASGHFRFVGPFWLAAKFFDTGSLQAVLLGSGPGTITQLNDLRYSGSAGWLKALYEYGIIGLFVFICFLASCLRRSRCPKPVLAAIIFNYFQNGDFFTTWICTIMIVLCTLHGPERRHRRIDRQADTGPTLAPVAG